MSRRSRVRCGLVLVALLGAAACSDDDEPAGGTEPAASGSTATTAAAGGARPLRVDLVDDAVAAVEAELGGPQRYFEINATPALVNLFVVPDDPADPVRAYAYLDGELTSRELAPGDGNAFTADALTFDPDTVTATVSRELPTSTPEVFTVEGGAGGTVRYTIVAASAVGGQLLVEVAPDGSIIGVETAG